jgi:hypothetical protein
MLFLLYIIIFSLLLFYIINASLNNKEFFCYGNAYCNGNKNNSICINQTCKKCGLQSSCINNNDCYPNECKNGCCDLM